MANNGKPNAENPSEENPKKPLESSVPPTAKPDLDPINASSTSTTDNGTPEAGHDAPLSDTQKKIRRAERFGISVQLSEKEKRDSRAERFGTGSTLQGLEPSKSEELKRKARAERFGIPSPSTTANEEAKKKARLARFAPVLKTDHLEEDKRNARALRFSNPLSNSSYQVNGEGNTDPGAIAGKAGRGA